MTPDLRSPLDRATDRIEALTAERDAAVAEAADLEMRLHVMDHEQTATEVAQGIEIARLRMALRTIADLPIPEQDNMLGANMRYIALKALAT